MAKEQIERANLTAEQVAAAEKEMAEKATKNEMPSNQTQTVDTVEQLAKRYHKLYPKSTELHITSDLQVFLEGDKNMAILHQQTLKDGELTTKTY